MIVEDRIPTTTTSADGVIRRSYRKPRVLIHIHDGEMIPCLSVEHAAQRLEGILGRRVPKTAITNHSEWLYHTLVQEKVHLSFPDSIRRYPWPLTQANQTVAWNANPPTPHLELSESHLPC